MNTNNRQKIVYFLFIIAVIWGVYNMMGESEKQVSDIPRPAARKGAVASSAPIKSIDIKKYNSLDWGRDPFYRGEQQGYRPIILNLQPVWRLGGILYDKSNPSAIINKKIVRGGDIIDGARVVQIDKETVILDKEGLQFTLTIEKEKS